jgi:hypothetical protein
MLEGLRLWLWQGGRKIPGLLLVLKSGCLVGTVAKGLAGRVSAPAQSDCRATRKAVRLAIHIEELYFPLDAQGAIIADGYFRG